eukprot:5922180-Prymnesium_polylepis.1
MCGGLRSGGVRDPSRPHRAALRRATHPFATSSPSHGLCALRLRSSRARRSARGPTRRPPTCSTACRWLRRRARRRRHRVGSAASPRSRTVSPSAECCTTASASAVRTARRPSASGASSGLTTRPTWTAATRKSLARPPTARRVSS